MLFRELLSNELEEKSAGFRDFVLTQADDLQSYLDKLRQFSRIPYQQLCDKLEKLDNIGAFPSEELKTAADFAFSFAEKWRNHEEARQWAFEILHKRTTFAADGSQLFIERDVSFPVGAIQIGWFENPHDDAKSYTKSAEFSVLPPGELMSPEEPFVQETVVGLRRFEAEIEKISEFLRRQKHWQENGERMPLAFYDNTLLLSMSLPRKDFEEKFVEKLVGLVELSRAAKVPLVGYVDRSYARDLLGMLDALDGAKNSRKRTMDDASLLHAAASENLKTLQNWGDRSCFCYSKRRGLSAFIDEKTGRSIVGFCYLQTTSDNPPARIDIPAWIYEDGLLNEVLEVVRAECVVGLGYPYALETADQVAVITMRDREIFLQALQGFSAQNDLGFKIARKAASKGRRR